MLNSSSAQRSMPIVLVVLSALMAAPAWCQTLTIPIEHYFVSQGVSKTYFVGKLLTANDLGGEQTYLRGADRYLGPSVLPLSALFDQQGFADVLLELDASLLTVGNFSEPSNLQAPLGDDMIFLDPSTLTWRGRLYVPGANGSPGGVYDDLSGGFSNLTPAPVPIPAAGWLLAAGLCSLLGHRARRR